MDQVSFVDKYRPEKLNDIILPDMIRNIFKNYIENKNMPHLLFYGPSGTGKTSSIVTLAKEVYGKSYSCFILELNGSDDRGISIIRDQIKQFAKLKNYVKPNYPKLIILDEADSLTFDAQFALRRIIEIHTKQVRFCIICNYVHKIIDAIRSRCLNYRFLALSNDQIKTKISQITTLENIKISKSDIDFVLYLAKGDMRFILNTLELAKIYSTKKNQLKKLLTNTYFGIDWDVLNDLYSFLQKKSDIQTIDQY
jgi:replication factor C subunit 3/5